MTFTSFSSNPNAVELANAIIAPDASLTLSSAQHYGSIYAASYYDGSISQLGIGAGIMLSTGTATPPESNTQANYSTNYNLEGNPDLYPIVPPSIPAYTTYDASTLSLSVEITDPNVHSITLTLVYATEDYPEYEDTGFTDEAAVLVNGELVGNGEGEDPAMLGYFSTLPSLAFSANSGLAMEYDGYSAVMTVVASVVQGTNTIDISIVDRADHDGDSALFVSNLTTMGVDAEGMYRTTAGTAGNDSIDNSAVSLSLFYELGAGADLLHMGTGDSVVRAGTGDDQVFGGTAQDAISGDDGADDLRGAEGNDQLDGGAGNDVLQGNAGDDFINGGADVDRVDYLTATGGVTVDLALGTASGEGNDTIVNVEDVFGSTFADTINGDAAANIINGRGGSDIMSGGAGDDIYYVDDAADQVVENAAEGNDSVRSSVTYLLGGGIENLTLSGSANIDGTGNSLANTIIGNSGDNRLNGAGGADSLRGGAGDDTYFVNDAGDRAVEGAGAGNDTVRSSVTFTLGNNVETLILTGTSALNGTGNALANTLIGNSSNNVLNGAGGADIMRGGQGDDIYVVDDGADRAVEGTSAGYDIVRASVAFAIDDNIEELVLTGTASVTGDGNNIDNRITGNSGNNFLLGRNGDDVLIGLSGDDRLAGGTGADNLNGGAGNDWVEGGVGQDLLTGGTGADLFVFYDGDFGGSTGGTADRVRDFSHLEGDRIRLNFVDANTANGAGTNEAFSFIGTQGFHNVAGELRYEQINANTYVFGDTDGDGVADFAIRVDGLQTFVSADFVL